MIPIVSASVPDVALSSPSIGSEQRMEEISSHFPLEPNRFGKVCSWIGDGLQGFLRINSDTTIPERASTCRPAWDFPLRHEGQIFPVACEVPSVLAVAPFALFPLLSSFLRCLDRSHTLVFSSSFLTHHSHSFCDECIRIA